MVQTSFNPRTACKQIPVIVGKYECAFLGPFIETVDKRNIVRLEEVTLKANPGFPPILTRACVQKANPL